MSRAWRLRPGALLYRAQVRLRGAQDNQLAVLGEAQLHERSRALDPVLTTAFRRAPMVESSRRQPRRIDVVTRNSR